MEFHNIMKWISAWEKDMADRGYPFARISIDLHDMDDDGQCTYGWTSNINRFFPTVRLNTPEDVAQWNQDGLPGWIAGHCAFMEVDELFPEVLIPPPLLEDLRLGLVTLDDLQQGCPGE